MCRKTCRGSAQPVRQPTQPGGILPDARPELWEQTEGKITHLVAAGSTGGTISGTARFQGDQSQCGGRCPTHGSIFYEKWAHDRLVKPGKFEVEGVGKDSIPAALNLTCVDQMPRFTDAQAFTTCRLIARKLGMMVGGSAGGNVFAALELAKTLKGPAVVVAILCDSGTKYLSKIFNDDWMKEKGYIGENEVSSWMTSRLAALETRRSLNG